MNTQEAVEICNDWLAHLDRQQEKSIKMQRLAAQARKGPDEAKKAQAELRQMDRQPKVYDGARLRSAVEHLIAENKTFEDALALSIVNKDKAENQVRLRGLRIAELEAALQHFYDYGYDRGRCEEALKNTEVEI